MKNENPLNYVFIDDEKPVNYRELIEKYTYHWKWFILAILMALAAAFVYLRYTPQQYTVATSILIEDENTGGLPSELSAFEDMGLLGGSKKKVETEIGLLKSRTLMQNTVQALGINISYFTQGRVREMEVYKDKVPFNIQFTSKDSLLQAVDTLFSIQALSNTTFVLKNSDGVQVSQHAFDDVIPTDFGKMSVKLTDAEGFKTGTDISVKIQRYTQKDDSFDWHFDEYPEDHNELTRNGVRRLSTSILFTSDFTGADLMVEDPQGIIHTLDKQVGSAIVFPSTWLHKVSKLESGERYVLTAWAFGDI